jgi:anaerobic magnesium-protoporphyrin IX monomethyl ester cyclase
MSNAKDHKKEFPGLLKKVLLLNPPLSASLRGGALKAAVAKSIPYGLLSLASVIRKAGYRVSILDATNLELGVEETVRAIADMRPDYLGITTVTLSVENAAAVSTKIKARLPGIIVLAGGAHVSSAPTETMQRLRSFDVGVMGEGEETILEVLSYLDDGRSLDGVPGVIFRKDGAVVRNKRRPLIQDLDALPLPAWDLLRGMPEFYRPSAPSHVRLPSTTIVTSRGCNGNCLFCNSKALFGRLRCFSADYVVAMINHLIGSYGIRDISIYDDNFILDRERVERICRAMIDARLDLTWSCYSRADQGDPGLFSLMKRAGCWQVSFGIESGSQKILDFIRKGITLEQVRRTVVATKRAGIRTRGFFIMGHLLETPDTIQETIRFMNEIPLDDFHFTYFTPLPGTPAYSIADRYGTFDKAWSKTSMQIPVFLPKGLTAADLERYSKKAYAKFYFRPSVIAAYLRMLMRYPQNTKRLWNGFVALMTRVFSKGQTSES